MDISAHIGSLFLSPAALVLLPRGCAGCGLPDAVLCPGCRLLFCNRLARPVPGVTAGSVACARYTGAARSAVLAWKDHDDRECDIPFAVCLAHMILELADADADAAVDGGMPVGLGSGIRTVGRCRGSAASATRPIMVIPVPSSRASARARGRQHVKVLAKRVCRVLREEHGRDAWAVDVLEAGGRKRSVQLSNARQRVDRADERFRLKNRAGRLEGEMVLLLDDIITTGSTMRACVGTLASAGVTVHAVLALADTPPRGPHTSAAHVGSG